jgi:Zn-dependent protease with chaperone function
VHATIVAAAVRTLQLAKAVRPAYEWLDSVQPLGMTSRFPAGLPLRSLRSLHCFSLFLGYFLCSFSLLLRRLSRFAPVLADVGSFSLAGHRPRNARGEQQH